MEFALLEMLSVLLTCRVGTLWMLSKVCGI